MEINKTRSRTLSTATKHLASAGTLAAMLSVGQAYAQQSTSLDSAVSTATNWAAQADNGQADAMWQASNPAMQKSVSKADWSKYVEIDPRYFRPTEVDHLHGDPGKARKVLGWKPKVSFKQLIEMMVRADEEDVRLAMAGRAPSA